MCNGIFIISRTFVIRESLFVVLTVRYATTITPTSKHCNCVDMLYADTTFSAGTRPNTHAGTRPNKHAGTLNIVLKSNTWWRHLNRQDQNDYERRSLLINKETSSAQKTAECRRASVEKQLHGFRREYLNRSIDMGDVRPSVSRDTTFTFSERNMFTHLTPAVVKARSTLRKRRNSKKALQLRATQVHCSEINKVAPKSCCQAKTSTHNNHAVRANSIAEKQGKPPFLMRSQSEPNKDSTLSTVKFNEKVIVRTQLSRTHFFERVEVETMKRSHYVDTRSVLFTEFCRKKAGFEKPVVQSCCGRRWSCPSTLRCRSQVNQLIDYLNRVPHVISAAHVTTYFDQ